MISTPSPPPMAYHLVLLLIVTAPPNRQAPSDSRKLDRRRRPHARAVPRGRLARDRRRFKAGGDTARHPRDRAAAEDLVAAIEDDCLPRRRDRAVTGEGHGCLAVAGRIEQHLGYGRSATVAHHRLARERLIRPGAVDKRYRFRDQGQCGRVRARSYHEAVAGGVKMEHVERLRAGDPDALALPDGVVDQAAVRADHRAVRIDDLAGYGHVRPPLLDEIGVAALADEADFLALGLVRDRQAEGVRELPHLRLGQVPKREAD